MAHGTGVGQAFASGADLTFATHTAAGSQSECQSPKLHKKTIFWWFFASHIRNGACREGMRMCGSDD
jgi:hypothetical protein